MFWSKLLAAVMSIVSFAAASNGAVVYDSLPASNSPFSGIPTFCTAPVTTVGSVDYAGLLAGDITPVTGYAGDFVSSVTFSVARVYSEGGGFDPELRFYATDGVDAGPGMLLYSYNASPMLYLATPASTTVTVNIPEGAFALPDGTFWVGVAFDDANYPGTDPVELYWTGQSVWVAPPTVGSTDEMLFSADSSGPFLTNDPQGVLTNASTIFGPNPAELEWSISVTSVPEPSYSTLLLLGAALVGSAWQRDPLCVGRRQAPLG